MKTIIASILLTAFAYLVTAQTFTDTINKEFVFEKAGTDNTLLVANINGDIHVMGYEGTKVIVEVSKKITAKTQQRLEAGKREIQLGVIDRADTLIFYMQGGCNVFGKQDWRPRNFGTRNKWSYNWEGDSDCDTKYEYKLDFTIKVPNSVNLVLSTINNGDIEVENVNGGLKVENINGNIRLKNISREAFATTINGNVDIEYAKNPDKPCRFYTLNGDVNAWFQTGLKANMNFKSFQGEFFTNAPNLESLPVQVEKESGDKGIKYTLSGNRFKIGSGGALLDFETFNGNVYLKERSQ
ncbi:MAG: DUF4097 family beta strand repeat protein [Cyclobacteriaceae bacterium]|nr:DUF4097 family beta strand repeat protein [Cyclobacteriaceae bacterium]